MLELTAENVEKVFSDCLFKEGEDTSKAKIAHCIVSTLGFHPKRLESHREDIASLLAGLPEEFSKGGGWSFLNACVTKQGIQWGEHSSVEQLLALGIATRQAEILMPRGMWQLLPGGMPYFQVKEYLYPEGVA